MCVSRPNVRNARRSRHLTADNDNSPTDQHTDTLSKLANSNFLSAVFEERVHVWVLPLSLSQSKYGGRRTPSSACTLITVQIAHDFLTQNIPLPPTESGAPQHLPLSVLEVLINAIVDGNETHERAMAARRRGVGSLHKKDLGTASGVDCSSVFQFLKRPQRDTFTVPEAIQVQRPEMHEVDYRCYSGDFIGNLVAAMTMVVTSPYLSKQSRLPIGVLAFERAMCFLYDRPTNSIILLDTHMHFRGKAGSVVCVASFENITDFIVAVTKLVFHEVFKTSEFTGQFEITSLMLTSLMNKVHKGGIFQPIKANKSALGAVKTRKLIAEKTADEDSGYETV